MRTVQCSSARQGEDDLHFMKHIHVHIHVHVHTLFFGLSLTAVVVDQNHKSERKDDSTSHSSNVDQSLVATGNCSTYAHVHIH